MSTKLKLQRIGTRSKPKYRLIVQEARSKVGGKVVEILGEYDPRHAPAVINFKKELVEKWLKAGAIPTDKVRFLFGKIGFLPPVDTAKLVKRRPKAEKKEEKKEKVPKAAEEPKKAEESPAA